jgi:hypothetical protein
VGDVVRAESLVSGGATLVVRLDETAAVWAVALPAGAPSPTADDVAAAAVAAAATVASVVPAAAGFVQSLSPSPSFASFHAAVLAAALADTESTGTGVGPQLQAPLTLTLSGLAPASR